MTGEPLDIRHVRTHDELAACVELQMATWGRGFRERVPATILKITQRLGGVTAGAFAPDGTLVGFVFGITGVEHGALVHWSDMLAVRAEAQNLGVGRRLKEFQRDAVRALGVRRMYWTFDPLVARNAHFNLERLGARVHEYVPDMYGTDTGSDMHSGFGTDRFVVAWELDDDAHHARTPIDAADAPVLDEGAEEGRAVDVERFARERPAVARIEIPADVFAVQRESVQRAARWRAATRRAFQWALANGYAVRGFAHDGAGRAFYHLVRE